MIRNLMASSALALLIGAGAFGGAQAQDAAKPAMVDGQATTQVAPADDTLQPEQPTLATAFIGRTVYSSEAPDSDNIGQVNDLIISDDGSITNAVIGVGGFLGIGEKDVSVPFDELQVVEREGEVSLIYAATREQLEAAPALDRTAYDPAQRFISEQNADTALAPASGTDAMAPADQTAMAPADPMAPAAAPAATAPDQTAMSSDMNAPAADTATNAEAVAPPADLQFVAFNADQWRASDLMGQSVYGPDDQSIGSVSDLVLQPDGGTRSALIDVGGFLGLGAKTVAIPIDQLTITPVDTTASADMTAPDATATTATTADNAATMPADQQMANDMTAAPADEQVASDATATQTEGEALANGNVRVTVAMTKEQLEALPEFTAPADRAAAAADAAATTADGTVATDQTQTAATDVPADATAPAEPMTTGSIGMEYSAATQELTARELTGATVYGSDESSIGEVGDLVLNKAGDIEAAIVDVGGFLGMGEKPVALALTDLQVRRDENGALMVMVQATKDQLTNAPTYEVAAQ